MDKPGSVDQSNVVKEDIWGIQDCITCISDISVSMFYNFSIYVFHFNSIIVRDVCLELGLEIEQVCECLFIMLNKIVVP